MSQLIALDRYPSFLLILPTERRIEAFSLGKPSSSEDGAVPHQKLFVSFAPKNRLFGPF